MQFFAKKYLVTICLITSILANVVAQEKPYAFTWLDRYEKKLAGNIVVSLVPQSGDGLYHLKFGVTWFNQDGKPIIDSLQMPFLCLSKYDLEIQPVQQFKCVSFEQKKAFNPFQSSGTLIMQVLNGYSGEVRLTARFQYALTKKLYESGKSELIDLMGTNAINMVFQVKSGKSALESDVSSTNKQLKNSSSANIAALRAVGAKYLRMQLLVKGFEDRSATDMVSKPNYREDLEALSAQIISERALIKSDSIPADTVQLYREKYNRLNDIVFNLQSDYLKFQLSQTGRADSPNSSMSIRKDDSIWSLVRNRVEPVVKRQVDSLTKLSQSQKAYATSISTFIATGNSQKTEAGNLDSLIRNHALIKSAFLNLKLAHENTYNNYRIDIDRLKPVREIENLHSSFLKSQNDVQSAIDLVENEIAAKKPDQEASPWYMSNRLLWTGLLAVLVFVIVSAIWSSTRNKKILREGLNFLERGNSLTNNGKTPDPGIFSNEASKEYFTVNYEITIPESVVGKIHYHSSAIKTVYLLVHGTLLEKKGGDFGGYLFGNQYKLPGKGVVRSEIFVEKACDSKYLRSSITNDIGARADLVDELDELVRQNSKYRLVGWFTSSADSSMEIPEGLMKIHRSFFKEKWQIGILLNPVSDVLQGASFLRRKTGYLDPMPDPSSFVKWDELYRFALNPAATEISDPQIPEKHNKDYSRIALNNTWGDSVVTAVNFDITVMGEITAVAANQAIPKDTYQIVGYLYGIVEPKMTGEGRASEYEVFVDRFIELSNEMTPRELPGLTLLGWWGQANVDVMNYLQAAVDYHENSFRDAYQISCLVNQLTGELRIFTRKHSLEMNNSTIETEEYSLKSLLSR